MLDIYRHILGKAIFPAFEAMRGRPTVQLLQRVRKTERLPIDHLRILQVNLLRRLIRHAAGSTAYYRRLLEERSMVYTDFNAVQDLERLPLLDRKTLMSTLETRRSNSPPFAVITKMTSGSSGEPAVVFYNAESRHWRDAIRWRGYGWAGYEIGMRALHYWGAAPEGTTPWWKRQKAMLDHKVKRDLYLDCGPRGDEDYRAAVDMIRKFRPQIIVAYASGVAGLARYINDRGLKIRNRIPVLTGAEALTEDDREAVESALGPAFSTYGCREVMLIASECEAHDGMHVSMENLIVEIVVRDPSGTVRAALPGETGEVVVTDLHNLACPMIRYVVGDLAVALDGSNCKCGRSLAKIGRIEGRVTDRLVDARGQPVSGLVFNIALGTFNSGVKDFQIHQKSDRSITLKAVPASGLVLPDATVQILRAQAERYLPGVAFSIEVVDHIPLTPAGKRRVVVSERTS